MFNLFRYAPLLILPFVLVWFPDTASGAYLAVSLDQLEQAARANRSDDAAVNLGGITQMLGMVVDDRSGDTILVGRRDPSRPPLTRDHLASALRALYQHKAYPLVSLDATANTPTTHQLRVRFEGGVERSKFGSDLLLADVALKRLALGLLPAKLWGVSSYLDLSAQAAATGAAHARFWFRPKDKARLVQRDGVFFIRRLDIGVSTEIVGTATAADPAAGRFASTLEAALGDVATANPDLAKVKPLFDLVALAAAIHSARPADSLSYWLHQLQPAAVDTPADYPTLRNVQNTAGGVTIEVEGGLDLEVLAAQVARGDTSALRQTVLLSRPKPDSLVWSVPLSAWPVDGPPVVEDAAERSARSVLAQHAGASVLRGPLGPTGTGARVVPALTPASLTRSLDTLPTFRASAPPPAKPPSVGGVWLSAPAAPATGQARWGTTGARFSLLVDGSDAQLPAEQYRRFVTALWAVYFSATPPGISIDPMGPGEPKHLVRYIGNVVNSDLGRVMRESDYRMKQLAVGNLRLALPGFHDVDSLSGIHGLTYAGASRRFWFVPEGLSFSAADGVLRFNGGRMTLKTEYVLTGNKKAKAEPADLRFADFFTKHYNDIAAREPIFADLLDYAKLVGLASYLKQQHIPLLWFLLANRDQVLTEDSPGSVDAIVRKSRAFQGMRIEGGVDLSSSGRYLPDPQVVAALQRANWQPAAPGSARAPSRESASAPQSLEVGSRNYTVLPQDSPAAGHDASGRRYQTDIALVGKDGQPGLELVRYLDPAQPVVPGDFGDGWKLLRPYRIEPTDDGHLDFRNARIPARMTVIDLLSGQSEMMEFSESRYAIAGWVPAQPGASRWIGLFPLTDGSFRLADKLNAEFAFDPAGQLTDLALSPEYQIHFETSDDLQNDTFLDPPYRLAPVGKEGSVIPQGPAPSELRLEFAGGTQTLSWRPRRATPGYYPQDPTSPFEVVVRTGDGQYRLRDQAGDVAEFDATGRFLKLRLAQPAVVALTQGQQRIDLRYALDGQGRPRIAQAATPADPSHAVRYDYDARNRLLLAKQVRQE